MNKKLFLLPGVMLTVLLALCSCSTDDSASVAEELNYSPSSMSELQGLYTWFGQNVDDENVIIGLQFDPDNVLEIYGENQGGDQKRSVTVPATYSYNASTGYGKYFIGDSLSGDFFAEKSGFISLYDEDDPDGNFNEGVWLPKCTYTLDSLRKETVPYSWEYPKDFGCTVTDVPVLDITDIGYQDSSNAKTRAGGGFEWTISGIAKWAGANIASGAVSGLASAGVNAILTCVGVGMGAQLNEISLKLDNITAKLDQILPKLNKILDGQAESQFNAHKKDLNELNSKIMPYFAEAMEEKDSTARMEILKQFNAQMGTTKTAEFLDNIMTLTIQGTDLYGAYDKYIYQCYPWENQGYVARETFRSNDLLVAFEGTLLSVIYYHNINKDYMVQQHLSKFATYYEYYNNRTVKRENDYAVSQIPNCKVRIKKEVDVRDFRNCPWIPKSMVVDFSGFRGLSSKWTPGEFAWNLRYGNTLNIPASDYNYMGLHREEVDAMLNYYKGEKTLQDILFNIAGCIMPFSESEMQGKTICIMRHCADTTSDIDLAGASIQEDGIYLSAYTTDNKFIRRKVGVPKYKETGGFWIFADPDYHFEGWESYDSNYLWVYPTVIR